MSWLGFQLPSSLCRWIFPLLAAGLLAGCTAFDVERIGLNDSGSAQDEVAAQLPPAQRREHERLVTSYGGVYRAPALEALIGKTVERLSSVSETPAVKYRVTILNSPAINAFALPGGSLYITRGLIALANDTSELASVLSHEMAHVVARHASSREEQIRQAVIESRVISDVLSDPDLGALALAKSKLSLATFSRGQELEADAVGVGISSRAGYDPFGASRFLTAMGKYADLRAAAMGAENIRDRMDFLSSHPSTPERISIAFSNARQFTAPENAERDRNTFLETLDGVVYGDDPKEGFVRGRRFIHSNLGFTFTAPEGFSLENTPQAVLGATANGRHALRLDAVRLPATTPLNAYIGTGWIEGIDLSTVQTLDINGFPAATALARGEQWSFRLFAIRFGSDVYRLAFAARDMSPAADVSFRNAAASFRRLTVEESKGANPLRISIVRVGLRDTVEKMAARMAVPDRKLERFLILNGFERNTQIKMGMLVKLVTE